MPRRAGTKPIYYQLPEDHPALLALDAYCTEWDKSRADASKDIVIAWAKARSGDLSALSGLLGITLGPPASTPSSKQDAFEKGLKRSPSRNAQSVDLDL
jgi:hypothetical protein